VLKASWRIFGKHPDLLEPEEWAYMAELAALELIDIELRTTCL